MPILMSDLSVNLRRLGHPIKPVGCTEHDYSFFSL